MSQREVDIAELRAALEFDQLVLHYQPKVDTVSGDLRGLEALVRWIHPTRGVVPPLGFIALAEEGGLIEALGEWVLREACRQQAEWAEALGREAPPSMCVNVSRLQLVPGFVDVVRRALTETGVVPEGLCLEITETAVLDDVDGAVRILQELKQLGLSLSIDDFGTGQSSLSHLQRFPVDEIKIDKTFIERLEKEPDDDAIVAAIVGMAHALGLLVIAEGVETMGQLRRLQALECDMVQGYLFSRPIPAGEVAALKSSLDPHDSRAGAVTATKPRDTILIVDDSPEVRAFGKMSLATSGFEVIEAASGEEAIAQAQRFQPSGVVLDIDMPGMDGFEVCRALRSDPITASVAIVILTSFAGAAHKIRAFSSGADDYMLKPFAPRELASRLRQALARRAAAGVSVPGNDAVPGSPR